MSGTADLVVAGGVQNMSADPDHRGDDRRRAVRVPRPVLDVAGLAGALRRPGGEPVPRRRAHRREVEHLARRHGGVRGRVARARAPGARRGSLRGEIVAARRRHVRRRPARAEPGEDPFAAARSSEGGRITAAVSSQISDASAALLIASEQAVKDHGLTPRARIHHLSVRADDPIFMLTAPIPATEYALAKTGHDQGRHRPRRDQRGVRVGRARVAAGERLRSRQGERERRRDRARSPARRHRCPPHDHAARTSSSAPAAATACRRCARAAARPTSPSSSACDRVR